MSELTKRIPGGNPDKTNLDVWKSRVEQCDGFTDEEIEIVEDVVSKD
jgi:hypothetical protein